MIDIAWLRQANRRVEQQDAVERIHDTLGQLFVGPVQQVTRLKGDDIRRPHRSQPSACLRWGQAQVLKIVMLWETQHLETAGKMQPPPTVHLCHQRMAGILGAIDLLGDFSLVPGIYLFYGYHGEHVVVDIAQRDLVIEA